MVSKILGYIFAAAGLLAVAVTTIPGLRAFLAIPIPEEISDLYLIIGGIILVVIGAFLIKLSSGKSGRKARQKALEVPIYQGKEIVGYRVAGKK